MCILNIVSSVFIVVAYFVARLQGVFALPPMMKSLPECVNQVAPNPNEFNAYLASEPRLDYCCMASQGLYVVKDCRLKEPTTTITATCKPKHYAEISHGAKYCEPWTCLHNGKKFIFDASSVQSKVIINGSSTKNIQCKCSEEKWLEVDPMIDVGFCRNLSICKPGEGVAVPAAVYSDVQCMECPDGTFQSFNTTAAKCQMHKTCVGGKIKVHGNKTHNTECASAAYEVVITTPPPTTTPTTTTTSTKASTTAASPWPGDNDNTEKANGTPQPVVQSPVGDIIIAFVVVLLLLAIVIVIVVYCYRNKTFCCRKDTVSSLNSSLKSVREVDEAGQNNTSVDSSSSNVSENSVKQVSEKRRDRRSQEQVVANTEGTKEDSALVYSPKKEDKPSTSNHNITSTNQHKSSKQPNQTPTVSYTPRTFSDEPQPNNKAQPIWDLNEQSPGCGVSSAQPHVQNQVCPAHPSTIPQIQNATRSQSCPPQNHVTQIIEQRRTQRDRTSAIFHRIRRCQHCLRAVLNNTKSFAEDCRLSDEQIYNIWNDADNKNIGDKFSMILNTILGNGEFKTPELLINHLETCGRPIQALIDSIQLIIDEYDANHREQEEA